MVAISREESVPSRLNELLVDVLFLLINDILALECGIVNITLATLNKRSNSQIFVPGFFKSLEYPHNLSTMQGPPPGLPFSESGISLFDSTKTGH